jgi:Spy/CpxP family protein refolding chaperone
MTPRLAVAVTVALLALGSAAPAQHQPYAGLEQRPVKALSPEQIADLSAGRGMGLALAAELNGYPGPRHVLDLAEPLGLSADQRARTEALFNEMAREASALGATIISGETALDRLFASKQATEQTVRAAVAELGTRQGELRLTHLKYHLAMVELLSPEQTARYNSLRGYAADVPAAPVGAPHRHRH